MRTKEEFVSNVDMLAECPKIGSVQTREGSCVLIGIIPLLTNIWHISICLPLPLVMKEQCKFFSPGKPGLLLLSNLQN